MHFKSISCVGGLLLLGTVGVPTYSWAVEPSPTLTTQNPSISKRVATPRASSKHQLLGGRSSKTNVARTSAQMAEWDGLKISDVTVQGLKRIEKDAVLTKISSKAGLLLSPEGLRNDIQTLFNMGYFDDLEFQGERVDGGMRLILIVRERPVISKITFEGNEKQTKEELEAVIKVKQWSILDQTKVKDDTALLTKHYEDKGFYLTKITFDVKSIKAGEVEIVYRVNDYEKVQIKKITFLNNKAFTDAQLKSTLMETKEGGFFSFMGSSGNFKESAFKTDLQRLTYWYLDQGYVKFHYDAPSVTVSDDKKWVYITIHVEEGDKYQMGKIDFSGDLLFGREELGQDIGLKAGEAFSISRRNADIQKLTEKYQDLGYAFTNVIPKMDVKDEEKLVDIDYVFEKGNLAYFGEITVVGNTKTHDKVIRRELKIKEGELYHGTRLRQSKENVERLGFFQPGEVLFNTTTPKGKNDIVDVEIQVKERPTGTVTLGAGYGSVQGLFFTTTISESNFLGRGQNISLATNITRDRRNKSVNLGFSDPYIFDTKWNAGFDAYYTVFFIPSRYTTRRFGGNARVGYPIYEFTNAFMTYKRERMKIEEIEFPDPDQFDREDIAADDGELSSFIWSVVRDKRNNRFETTDGNFQSASLEYAGIGGDKKFVKWSVNNRYYTPVVGDLVFRNNIEFGQIRGFGGERVPPSEKFYLGGPNNLRGFQFFSVGPTRTRLDSNGNVVRIPLGGDNQLYGMFELEHPIIREAGLKFVSFVDVGTVFTHFEQLKDTAIRRNFGFGIRWFSPIGPLRFEWGFPMAKRPGEDNSVFQFFIGPPF